MGKGEAWAELLLCTKHLLCNLHDFPLTLQPTQWKCYYSDWQMRVSMDKESAQGHRVTEWQTKCVSMCFNPKITHVQSVWIKILVLNDIDVNVIFLKKGKTWWWLISHLDPQFGYIFSSSSKGTFDPGTMLGLLGEQPHSVQKSMYNFWPPQNLTTNSLLLARRLTDSINSRLTHILYVMCVTLLYPHNTVS